MRYSKRNTVRASENTVMGPKKVFQLIIDQSRARDVYEASERDIPTPKIECCPEYR